MPFKRKAGPGCESKGPNKRAGNLVPGGGRGKAAADDGSDEELGEEVIFTFADQVALAATVEELGHGPPQLQPGFKKFAKAEQKRKKEQFRTVYRRYQARIVEWQAAKEDVQAELEALAELHESLVKEDYRELTGETDEDADVTFTGKDVQRFTSQILTLNAFVREREKGLDDLSHLRRLGTCEAAERVAPMFFISPVTVERTYAVWKKRGMKLRQSKKGRWNRHWLLAEEDLKADALKYIREKADPKGERAMTAESFAAWISTIIRFPTGRSLASGAPTSARGRPPTGCTSSGAATAVTASASTMTITTVQTWSSTEMSSSRATKPTSTTRPSGRSSPSPPSPTRSTSSSSRAVTATSSMAPTASSLPSSMLTTSTTTLTGHSSATSGDSIIQRKWRRYTHTHRHLNTSTTSNSDNH